MDDLLHQRLDVLAAERPPAGEQLVEHHAERVHVAVEADFLALDMLRRHVIGRAHRRGLHHLALLQERGAEVGDLHLGAFGNHDVRRLDVAVDDALARRVLQRAAALEADLQHVGDRQQLAGGDVPGQIAAHHQLHRDVTGILADHRVEDRDDMRVAQLAGERGLVQELRAVDGAELGIAEHLGLDGLERHFLAGEGVLREVDGAGRALAEVLLHFVFADLEREVHLRQNVQHLCAKH
jgi:hypothetical protein